MELFHRSNDVGDVLNHMDRADFAEEPSRKGIWKMIQIRDDVGAGLALRSRPIAPGYLLMPQPDIQEVSRRAKWSTVRAPSDTAPVYRWQNPPDRG